MKALQANSSQDSNDVHQLDPATKLQTWKEASGGKSRGRVYGTTDLAANFRKGVSSLTQASSSGTSQSGHVIENEMLHAELSVWSQKYAKYFNYFIYLFILFIFFYRFITSL